MAFESVLVELNGEETSDLMEDVASLEVELSDECPATFRLVLGTAPQPDGSWKYLDEERFRPWTPVTVEAGFVESGREEVFSGYVTRINPRFEPDPDACTLEVVGTDESVLMDREEKLKDWPDKKDSDIATEIIGSYGLTPRVDQTDVVHDEALSTVIQRETDFELLKRLALRNGLSFWVESGTAHFASVPVDQSPQPLLAGHFGEETNLPFFSATVDALRPTAVAMYGVDRMAKEVLSVEVTAGEQEVLGSLDWSGFTTPAPGPGKVYVGKNAVTGTPEMESLCRALHEDSTWFVEGEGEVASRPYGHVLKPRRLVTIKGVGETHSGVYYVSYVRHTFTQETYTQAFRVRRNALLPTGGEAFSSNGSPLGLL